MKVKRRKTQAIVDSGPTVSLISDTLIEELFNKRKKLTPYTGNVLDANRMKIPKKRSIETRIFTPNGSVKVRLLVFKKNNSVEHELILGMDLLRHASLDFRDQKIKFNSESLNEIIKTNQLLRKSKEELHIFINDSAIYGIQRQPPGTSDSHLAAPNKERHVCMAPSPTFKDTKQEGTSVQEQVSSMSGNSSGDAQNLSIYLKKRFRCQKIL